MGPSETLLRTGRGALVAACALLLAAPALLPPGREWPSPGHAGAAFVLAAACAGLALAARRFGAGRPLDLALAIGVSLYALLIGNGRLVSSSDNEAVRLVAPVLVTRGELSLAGLPEYAGERLPYSALWVRGRVLPAYPLGTALLATPIAGAMRLGGALEAPLTRGGVDRFEKYAGALFAVASTLLLWVGLRRAAPEPAASLATLTFALATTVFSTAGQGMFSFTGEVFCLCAALALILRGDGEFVPVRAAAAAGVLGGVAFLCRPTALIPAGAIALALLARRRREGVVFAGAAALAVALAASLQTALYGHPLGGYAVLGRSVGAWARDPVEGLLGTLVSPSRGLLVFQPYLILAVCLAAAVMKAPGGAGVAADAAAAARAWRRWSLAAVVTLACLWLVTGLFPKWWGGSSLGPRLFTEAAPLVALLTVPMWQVAARARWARWAAGITAGFAAATQLLLAYNVSASYWNAVAAPDRRPASRFTLRNSQLLAAWLPGWRYRGDEPPPPELVSRARHLMVRVDPSPAANTRYDLDPFEVDPGPRSYPHFPRLDAARFNRRGALFRFAPAGTPNALTTCGATPPGALPLPAEPVARVHAVLVAGRSEGRGAGEVAGRLEVSHEDGARDSLPVALERDVFAYAASERGAWPPRDRLYWGDQQDADALVRSTFELPASPSPVRALRLVPGESGGACLALLAVTLERPGLREDLAIPGGLDAPLAGTRVAGELTLAGWCQERGGGACVELVAIVDGGEAAAVVSRLPRPDVTAAIPEIGPAGTAGFRLTLPYRPGLGEERQVAVVAYTADGRWRRFGPVAIRWRAR